jgi:hypothetical protein
MKPTFVRDQTPVYGGGPGSIPGQFMCDLWRTMWHWGKFFSEYVGFPHQFAFYQILLHLSSGANTVGHLRAEYQGTPPHPVIRMRRTLVLRPLAGNFTGLAKEWLKIKRYKQIHVHVRGNVGPRKRSFPCLLE